MYLTRKSFKEINLDDPFFDSLKADYSEFSHWFAKKAKEEELAYVFQNEHGDMDGFLYLKIEEGSLGDVVPALPSARRIKVGTLKINAHGTKLGERFLKKIFDHAIFETVKEIYVTVFAHHAPLVALLERYGFLRKAEKITQNGTELVLVRNLCANYIDVVSSYPLVRLDNERVFLLSLYPEWHTRLLPDSILKTESMDIIEDVSHTNSIHKVYLAAMNGIEVLKKGDVLLIYRTNDGLGPAHFRSVATSICVVEEYRSIHTFVSRDEFLSYCRPYSVFSEKELEDFWAKKKYPHVIRFTYNIALKKRVTRGTMIDEMGLNRNAYWGFMQLSREQFLNTARKGMIDESLIIH
ncbi:N-acetyltransferase [Legionella sp. km772]|uniref:N-acetyltransferase n=1 Tax=Legionella sp. km772 TaxID=2498111 RepID=UPI000F8CB659|nr:N-acetyltransferase [Legionella sp. km772]RUR05688.1 N-acetyltransferase [Legionella sp. km772]